MLNFQNCTYFDGQSFKYSPSMIVRNGKIFDFNSQNFQLRGESFIDCSDYYLSSGFIDIQVNGGGGIYLNEEVSFNTLNKIEHAHVLSGTTSFLPTLITDSFEKMLKAAEIVKKIIAKNESGILGIHFEGPYINKDKKGIHDEKFIRSCSDIELSTLIKNKLPIMIVTLAPEIVGSDVIKKLTHENILVSVGHSNATSETMKQAFINGARCVTHLFNACSQITSREPNIVGFCIAEDYMYCGVIGDGLHVHPINLKILFKAKSLNHILLVSDAMSAVGTQLKEFNIGNEKIFVTENGTYVNKDGTLAGSSFSLFDVFKFIVKNNFVSLEDALKMCTINPARYLSILHRKGKVEIGYDADLILIRKSDLSLGTVIQKGRIVHANH